MPLCHPWPASSCARPRSPTIAVPAGALMNVLADANPGARTVGWPVFRTKIPRRPPSRQDRKSTRLNSSHQIISYAVFRLKKQILILNSFLGSSDSLVFSELFHSLAPRPLAARSISDFLLPYLAT